MPFTINVADFDPKIFKELDSCIFSDDDVVQARAPPSCLYSNWVRGSEGGVDGVDGVLCPQIGSSGTCE